MNELTEKRKEEHINTALKDVEHDKSTLFEYVEFIHNALPELSYEEVNTEVSAFGKRFSFPLLITGMTGGYRNAKKINLALAKTCSSFNIPMGVGSQRAMIENPSLKDTYDVKKEYDVFLIGNIGGYQLKEYPTEKIEEAVKAIDADALAIHLNPLQELIQPEGDRDWSNVLPRIAELRDALDVPLIIKEVGSGVSREVAFELSKIGVEWIDVAGLGGTSWSKIEYMRGGELEGFEEWGIPTALSVLMTADLVNVIASGGIRSGIDGAKAIALGAKLFGAAKPFLKAAIEGTLSSTIALWREQFKATLFLTGSSSISEFRKKKPFYIFGELRERALSLGLHV